MKIVHSEEELEHYMKEAVKVSPDRPILLDRFLEDAVELDIDAVADGEDVLIGGVMEHIEPAGVHSGDSACVLPAQNISREELSAAREHVEDIAREFGIVGFLNVQCAVKDGKVYVLEANPRASRTIPFVSKHSGVPLARVAAQVMLGSTLEELDAAVPEVDRVSVKEVVFPFDKFDDVDMNLGPEMKSTGEAMGIGATFGEAFYKAQEAAKNPLPLEGRVLVVPGEKEMKERVEALERLGFEVDVGSEEDLEDYDFLVDLSGTNALKRAAIDHEVTYVSTVQALDAAIEAIETVQNGALNVSPLKGRTH